MPLIYSNGRQIVTINTINGRQSALIWIRLSSIFFLLLRCNAWNYFDFLPTYRRRITASGQLMDNDVFAG